MALFTQGIFEGLERPIELFAKGVRSSAKAFMVELASYDFCIFWHKHGKSSEDLVVSRCYSDSSSKVRIESKGKTSLMFHELFEMSESTSLIL
jgi:hypothetical protein